MKPESLIFDIDGTLWDSRAAVARGYNRVLTAAGQEARCVTVEQLRGLFGKTMTEIADAVLPNLPQAPRYALMEQCMVAGGEQIAAEEVPGYPGVAETLAELKNRYRLFIVSNSQVGYPELVMRKLGLTDLFEGHLCFGDTGTDKGATIRTLMEKHRIGSAVYIGDTQGDQEASAKAGIPFVWAAYGFGSPEVYDACIDCFAGLTELF